MARRARNYHSAQRTVHSLGSLGTVGLIGSFQTLEQADQNYLGYLDNVKVSCLLEVTVDDNPVGIMYYITNEETFDNGNVICAGACNTAGTIWLPVRRKVGETEHPIPGTTKLYLWGELSDTGAVTHSIVSMVEFWGRLINFEAI